MQPNARLIMITPICAHTLTQRSIIFGQDDEIVIQMNDNKNYQRKEWLLMMEKAIVMLSQETEW